MAHPPIRPAGPAARAKLRRRIIKYIVKDSECFGILAIVPFIVFNIAGGMDALCDRPIPYWLLVTAVVSFTGFGLGLISLFFTFCMNPKERTVDRLTGEELYVPAPPPLSECLDKLHFVLHMFLIGWYIWGNVNVWLTSALDATGMSNLTRIEVTNRMTQGNLQTGEGCDAELLTMAWAWLIFTYALVVVAICFRQLSNYYDAKEQVEAEMYATSIG